MAKLNSVLIPKASGSIGNITFRSIGRNTVASEKIVQNTSRTAAQQVQRASFKERMVFVRRIKTVAPLLFKKHGFRSPFAELSSRAMLLNDIDWGIFTRSGNFNFGKAAEEKKWPQVEGDVTASNVTINLTDNSINVVVPRANFIPRKGDEPYGITAAACILTSDLYDNGTIETFDVTDDENPNLTIGEDGDNLVINMVPQIFKYVPGQTYPIISVNVNGKRIGYSEFTHVGEPTP